MKVASLCSRHPVTVSASAPLSEVAQLMYEHRVGAVIVTRSPSDRPVAIGIVTDRDVVRAQLDHSADLSRLSAADAMTANPTVVCEDFTVEKALERLRERGVRRAPVEDATGALTGMISTDDLVVQLAHEVTALGRLLERQAPHGVQPLP